MTDRYGTAVPDGAVRDFLDRGAAERVVLSHVTRAALGQAVASGWACVIVTNGRAARQEAKIRDTGLDRLVHGGAVSEAVGHEKPAPEIFLAAAAAAGASPDGAWAIGDSPHADIRGALAIGARSVVA